MFFDKDTLNFSVELFKNIIPFITVSSYTIKISFNILNYF